MRKGAGAIVFALIVLIAVAGIGIGILTATDKLGFGPDGDCTATVDGHTVDVNREQAENATLIAAIGIDRGLPARAVSIALATAYQESKLENIDHGDRDSLGLFQQRPSQGWGSEEEILDPAYSTNAFYDALVEVEGYEDMEITVAAQEVQRSAFPNAYADHEDDARALASALTGYSEAAFSCDLDGGAPGADADLVDSGLTARAERVRVDLVDRFGELSLGGFQPGGVSDGHMEGSAHYDGRAIDIFYRPINEANQVRGWSMAHYLVGNASRLDIRTVIYDDRIWRAGQDGWSDYDAPSRAGDVAILEHRDHVHVDVFS